MTNPSPDLIAKIVDRDTPPDNRNEVVDHDIRGNPITRGMVEAFARPDLPQPQVEADRLEFESYIRTLNPKLVVVSRWPGDDYKNHEIEQRWQGWLAAKRSFAASQAAPDQAIAKAIHYPDCWDTAAYPALADALSAVYDHFKCSECQAAPATT